MAQTLNGNPCPFHIIAQQFQAIDKKELQQMLGDLAEGPEAIIVKKDLPRGNSVYFLKPMIFQERYSGREDDTYIATMCNECTNLAQLEK